MESKAGMHCVALSLGSNLGQRAEYLRTMLESLAAITGPPLAVSAIMETEPLAVRGAQPWYFNRIVTARFCGSARELLAECQRIEMQNHRLRPEKNAPRTADIDILLFGEIVSNDPACIVPHPRLRERRFCLEGLFQIAPRFLVPGVHRTVAALYNEMSRDVRRQTIIFYEQ